MMVSKKYEFVQKLKVKSTSSFLLTVAEIGFAPSVYSVTEDSGSVIFFIQNLNPDIQREVVVEFMTVGGTATGT